MAPDSSAMASTARKSSRTGSRTVMVLTTVESLRQARRMARTLVQRHLTACVHISPIESIYHWDGRLHQEREFRLAMKTTTARAGELQSALRTLHPYELPAIYVVALGQVHAAYAHWVERSCAPARAQRGTRSAAKSRTAGHT